MHKLQSPFGVSRFRFGVWRFVGRRGGRMASRKGTQRNGRGFVGWTSTSRWVRRHGNECNLFRRLAQAPYSVGFREIQRVLSVQLLADDVPSEPSNNDIFAELR